MAELKIGQTGLVDIETKVSGGPTTRVWGTVSEIDPASGLVTFQLFASYKGQTTATVPPDRVTVNSPASVEFTQFSS